MRGGILGWTASMSFSNSARVMTVLQSAGAAPFLSQRPLIVTTGVVGGTSALDSGAVAGAPPAGLADALAGLAGFWADAGAVFAAWPQARAPNSRQTNPYRVITGIPPEK